MNLNRNRRIVFVLVSGALLALVMVVLALQPVRAAGPWYVAPGGDDGNDCLSPGAACATISGALAKASAGDTIYVATGTYTGTGDEVVLLDKDATLSGGWGADFAAHSGFSIIDGEGARRGITVHGGVTAVIDRFTVQNGYTGSDGGGVRNSGTLTMTNCAISDNFADYAGYFGHGGGGISNVGALTLISSTVSNNTSIDGGGGILATGGSSTVIMDSKMFSNTASSWEGGGIQVHDNSALSLYRSWVVGNVALGNDGGGIGSNNAGSVYVENSIIAGNIGGTGGGLFFTDGQLYHIVNSHIVGNKARYRGAAIVGYYAQVEVTNTLIISNTGNTGIDDQGSSGSEFVLSYCDTYGNSPDGTNEVTITRTNCLGTPPEDGLNPLMLGGALPEGAGPAYAAEWMSYDYRLLVGSPAIDAGTAAGAPAIDIEGNLRDATPDMGAYELVPGVSLSPRSQTGVDKAGSTVAYTILLGNHTGATDSFSITLQPGNAWTTTLSLAETDPIPDGDSLSFTAWVEIPAGASPGEMDSVTIQATSLAYPTVYSDTTTIATHAMGDLAYVTLSGSNMVALVDTASHTVMGSVDVGSTGCYFPWQATMTPDRAYVYVSCYDSGNVVVIETAGNTVATTVGGIPSADGIAFTRDGAYALVGSRHNSQVAVVDTATYSVDFISTPSNARSVAVHPYLDVAYVTSGDGTVQVIDTTSFSIVTSIPVGAEPWDVAVSPDGAWVFAGSRWGEGLAVIAAGSNTVHTTVTGLGELTGLAVAPDGSEVYAAGLWNGVHVIDGLTFDHITTVWDVGAAWELAVTCDGTELYVGNRENYVAVIDTTTRDKLQIPMPGSTTRGIAICPQTIATGMFLVPASQVKYDGPGEVVTYEERVVNASGRTDSFTLSLAGNAWDTSLSVADTGPVPDGDSFSITVWVTIPVAASPGETDSVTLEATSVTSPTVYSDTATMETRVMGDLAYVTLSESNLVALVDMVSYTAIGSIDVGSAGCQYPWRATMSPDRAHVYVACRSSGNVAVIETAGNTVVTTIDGISSAGSIAFVREGTFALVGSRYNNQVAVVDTATYSVDYISTPSNARSVAAHPYLDLAYATSGDGTVQVIDTTSFSIVTAISVGNDPYDVAVSPDGAWVFAGSRRGEGLAVIAAGSNTVHTTVTGLGDLTGLEVAPNGSMIYAAGLWNGLHIIDGATFDHITTLGDVGSPREVAVSCDGGELYIGNKESQVPVVDTGTLSVAERIAMPGGGALGSAICPQAKQTGMFLVPASQVKYDGPGEVVAFEERLVNASGSTDSFTLSFAGNVWDTGLSVADTGPVLDGDSFSFTVWVTIPVSALPGDADSVTLEATSVTSPTVYSDTATIGTGVMGDLAYVTLSGSDLVALVDTVTHTAIGSIDVGSAGCNFPWQATMTPDGAFVYVSCYNSGNVVVIETAGNTVVTTIGGIPSADGIAFTRDGAYALVGSRWDSQVAVVDTATYSVETISTPSYARSVAAHPYLDAAYATSGDGSVQVIDTTSFSIMTSIPVGAEPWDVAVSPDGQWVFAGSRWGEGLAVIDVGSNTVHTTVTGLGEVTGLEVAPDGAEVYAASLWNGVHIIDGATFAHITTVWDVGAAWELAVTCDGTELYVGNRENYVAVIDTATREKLQIPMPGSTTRGIAICPQHVAKGVFLSPPAQANSGGLGEMVAHQGILLNMTGATDTFSLELGSHAWDATLSADSLGPIPNGDSAPFTVYVTVPEGVDWYSTDTVSVTATSVTSPTAYSDTASLTTEAYAPPQISVSPDILTSSLYVDEIAQETLTIGNGNGVTLEFEIGAGSGVSFLTASTELYGYDVSDAWLRVVGTQDDTHVKIINLDNGTVIDENTDLDRYETWDVYPNDGTFYKIEANQPVVGYESDQEEHSAFVPSLDSGPVGTEFIFYYNHGAHFYVFAVQNADVMVYDPWGNLVASQTMAAGEYWELTLSDAVYHVISTGRIAMQTVGSDGYTTVPSITGEGVGRDFYFACYESASWHPGSLAVFAYEDVDVEVYDLDSSSLLYTQHINEGDYWWQTQVGTRRLELHSTGKVEVWVGATQDGSGIENLGDDLSFAGGDRSREYYLHSLMDGSVVFALFDNTQVDVDGSIYHLNKDEYLHLDGCCFFRHIQSNQPILIQTLGRDSWWDNLGTYLGGVLEGGGDLPSWLTMDATSGTVATNDATPVVVTFDATGLQPGTFGTELVVQSNDPAMPLVSVPVSMTVEPTADMGWVEGTVTDNRTGDPLEATIVALGQPFTITTDADTGSYLHWLVEGSYTLQVTAEGYVTEMVPVEIVAQQGTVQNLALVRNAPVVQVSPPDLSVTQNPGDVTAQTLTISNDGPAALEFEVVEHGMLPVQERLISWWPGEGDAADIVDGNDGTLEGGTGFVAGMVGQAFSFDGLDDQVNVGNAANLHVSADEFTILAWVRFDSDEWGDRSIADKMSSIGLNGDGWRLFRQRDFGNLLFCLGGGSANGCDHWAPTPPTTVMATTVAEKDVWYHVAGVLGSHDFSIYVNGALEDTKPRPTFTDSNSTDLLIGANAPEGAHLDGLVDEVMLFNRALTEAEVRALYEREAAVDAPWLSTDPISGTVSAYSYVPIEVTFDATGIEPGDHTAEIVILSNDPVTPSVVVPVEMTVNNLPPEVTVTPEIQEVQYSDLIAGITIEALDNVAELLSASTTWSSNGSSFSPGLPAGLVLTGPSCSDDGVLQTCTWDISGVMSEPAGTYTIRTEVSDGYGGATTAELQISVESEDADIWLDSDNLATIQVDTSVGHSPAFTLTAYIREIVPDDADFGAEPGDISNAEVEMALAAVGPGSSYSVECNNVAVTGVGYEQILEVACEFDDVEVNTYHVQTTVVGGHYTGGPDEAVLIVFDPSLGSTAGGGWFYWPDTADAASGHQGDKTNFGYVMEYNQKSKQVKGSLLLVRHLDDGSGRIYRVKSNALTGLSLGEAGDPVFGWASFNGKCTYKDKDWDEPAGNHGFLVYVEDHGEPGRDADQFWIEVYDKDGNVIVAMSMDRDASENAEVLGGGNIVVPHSAE